MTDKDALALRCRPLPGRVLVKLALTQKHSSDMLIMPASTQVKTNIGKVLRVGEGCSYTSPGMYVLLSQFSMRPLFQSEMEKSFFNEDNRYVVLDEEDILAKVQLSKQKEPTHG